MGYKHHKPVEEFSSSNNLSLNRKLKDDVCTGLRAGDQRLFLELKSDKDRELIADFITKWSVQVGQGLRMPPASKRIYITSLVYFSRSLEHKKSFVEMTREDIIDGYLASYKREFAADPDQKGFNTYRIRADTGVKKKDEALEIIPTMLHPGLIKDEKEEKEFLFSAAKVAREKFKERGEEGGGNKAVFTL